MARRAHLPASVIVPAHEVNDDLRRCLASLRASRPAPAEIIVVLDGASDEPLRRRERAGLRVVRLPHRGGPSRARNAGAAIADQPVLVFVDSDVTVRRDTLRRAVRCLEDDPRLSAVFGSYNDRPRPTNFLTQYKGLLNHYVHQAAHEDASTFWGACGVIRRDAFLALGGFDKLWDGLEDVELGHRLRRAGHRIRLDKDLLVTHHKRWSPVSLLRTDILHRARPWSVLIHREGRLIDDLNLDWSNRIGVLLAFVGLAASIACLWQPALALAAAVAGVALLCVHWPMYRFFGRARGPWFALRAIPWHWLYLLYGGATFAAVYAWCTVRAAGPRDAEGCRMQAAARR